jgi:UPF0755 protein
MQEKRVKKQITSVIVLGTAVTMLYVALSQTFFSISSNFPVEKSFLIDEGESIYSVSKRLEKEGYINHALFFRLLMSWYDHDRKLQIGYYQFDTPTSLYDLVRSMIDNGPTSPFGRVTVPEGSSDKEIAALIIKALPDLTEASILGAIEKRQSTGFLFPETYYVVPSMKEEELLGRMEEMFVKKVGGSLVTGLTDLSQEQKTSLIDKVILASILEGEANTKEDMKLVSGILQKRMEIGMPLQVDVAMETYKVRGLPKKPINNPGLVALEAAYYPEPSPYLYYITGKDGKMYYSKTYEEHKKNINRYLR